MGVIYVLKCSGCAYASKELYLGRGMDMGPEHIIGSCMSCNRLTTIDIAKDAGNCDLCSAKRTVVFTSFFVRPRPTNSQYNYRLTSYQCPVCHLFGMAQDSPCGYWD